ncbi:MAG: ABC transporter permease subunit [Trueperaceae bacterium]
MIRLPTLARVLRDHRRGLAIWALAVSAICAFYLSFYPAMGQEMMDAIQGLPDGLMRGLGYDRIGSAGGFANSVIYGLLAPLLLLVHAIGAGGRLIAGQEEDGSLELDFAAPISRRRLFLERLAALWTMITLLILAMTGTILVMNGSIGLDLAVWHVVAGSAALWLLVGGIGTIAYAIGAATGRRGSAVAIASAVAVGAYVLRGVSDATGNDLLGAASPFVWLLGPEPLIHGPDLASLAKLAAIPLLAAPLGLLRFVRRDLLT